MCDLSMMLMIGSTVLGAVGQIQQANAQAAAADYNAKVAEMNAKLSERRAQDAIERGAAEEQRKRMEVARIKGQQKVAMAANGVDLSFGSPLDTIVDTAVLGELDALTIRSNAYRESYDRQVDAANQRAGATLNRMEAKAAKTGGYLAAAGTILGGAGKAYGQYKQSTVGSFA
jgi:hypothetical protein